ncbi:MAG: calcium/sodium antiporter [Caldithrix sp.]|nr:calcium/sodium antiporter [Caldithrix sp.]
MILASILLILGFIILIKGADLFVTGASTWASRMRISQVVIGLTVVAFGTSAPELFINIFAALSKNSDISFGNIVGSNIVNILLILGIAGMMHPLHTQKNTVWREIPFAFLAALVLLIMVNDIYFNTGTNVISRGDGLILILFFSIFLTYTFAISKVESSDTPEIKDLSSLKITVFIVGGLIFLIGGGKLVVDNALTIARLMGMPERVIALTVVAIGTSLPELATSAVAAYRGKTDIAIGNVVGSNIFNIFLILGLTVIINPIHLLQAIHIEMGILLLASALLFLTMFTGKRRVIDRWEALILVIIYIGYTTFLMM